MSIKDEISNMASQIKPLISTYNDVESSYEFTWEIYNCFRLLPEPRDPQLVVYPLPDALTYFFYATLADTKTWDEAADFAHNHREYFEGFGKYAAKKYPDCPLYMEELAPFESNLYTVKRKKRAEFNENYVKYDVKGKLISTPSGDTLRRILSSIDGTKLNDAMADLLLKKVKAIRDKLKLGQGKLEHICNDGKSERGSGRLPGTELEEKPVHIFTSLNASLGVCLYSGIVDNKTNEIPCYRDNFSYMLKRGINLEGTMQTADCLHCQPETLALLNKEKALYTIGVKGNKEKMYRLCKHIFTNDMRNQLKANEMYDKTHDDLGAIQVAREYYMYELSAPIKGWESVKGLVATYTKKWDNNRLEDHIETRYYLTNYVDVKLAAQAIRRHWIIEILHLNMDDSYGSDRRRNKNPNCVRNVGIFIKAALCIHQFSGSLMSNEKKARSIRNVVMNLNADFSGYLPVILCLFNDLFLEQLSALI